MRIVSFFKLCEEDISDLIKIQKNKAFMENLPRHFSELETSVQLHEKLHGEIYDRYNALNEAIGQLSEAFEAERKRARNLSDDRISGIENRLASFISNYAANYSDTEKRLIKLEAENRRLTELVNALADENRSLSEKISQNESRISSLNEYDQKLIEQVLLLNTENKSQNERIKKIIGNGGYPTVKLNGAGSAAKPSEPAPSPADPGLTAPELKTNISSLSKPAPLKPAPSSHVIAPVDEDEFEFNDDKTILKKYRGRKSHVVIPTGIKRIDASCFLGCETMENVTIPEGVEFIEDYAFMGCSKLKEVILPSTLHRIEMQAFSLCSLLSFIVIPKGVTYISADAFEDCPILSISCTAGSYAEGFAKHQKISYTTLPGSGISSGTASVSPDMPKPLEPPVKSVEFEFNDDKTRLIKYKGTKRHVVIPIGVKGIDESCFDGCRTMQSIAIPEGVEYIGDKAFRGCDHLKEVILPSTVKRIGNNAFFGCALMQSIIIPKSTKYIASTAFYFCTKLTIGCVSGSYAEGFAKRTNIPFKIAFHKNCLKCGYSTNLLDKKKCPVCGAKEWKNLF